MGGFQTKSLRVLRSPQFFAAILLLFFIESAWIAVSAAYPMVFDENAHFAVIQAYAHHLNPFFSTHTPLMDSSGAVSRNPSFLYRWLMSFPYRIISAITGNQMIQIVDLRFIDIFMFGGALVLFRRLLLKTKVSPTILNVTFLFFVLMPVVPLLAGQINYDDMIMLVIAAALLMAMGVSETLAREQRLPLARSLWLLTLCLLGSLVQFEFLPIFAAIVLWLGYQTWRVQRVRSHHLFRRLFQDWQRLSIGYRVVLLGAVVLALGMFVEMYGVNLVRYHNLTPQCAQVLSVQQCDTNGTWVRNQVALAHKGHVNINPVLFGAGWTYRMFIGMFYTSSGGASPQANYLSVNPLPIIFVTAVGIFSIGVVLVIKYRKALFEDYKYLGFLLFTALIYVTALWLRNYQDYVHLGIKIAINGRYLLPVALPCMLVIALAFRQLCGHRYHLKVALLIVVLVLFLQGGGAVTYIFYSNSNWYWQKGPAVRLNKAAQQVMRPFIIMKAPLGSVTTNN